MPESLHLINVLMHAAPEVSQHIIAGNKVRSMP
jgi:hypothetical protein